MLSPLLFLHICGGGVGLLSGAVAISFRKGSRAHGLAGNVFFVSMLIMSGSGAYMALMKSQMNNVFGGVLTFYLVATAWVTAKRREGKPGVFDWGALLVAMAVCAAIVTYGVEAAKSPTGSKDGIPAGMYFFLASVALISAVGDIRMLVHGGIRGTQRVARHLWRMSFAWFVASSSLFLARPHLFPVLLRKTGVLFILGVLPLALMIFWLIRVAFSKAYKQTAPSYRRVLRVRFNTSMRSS
jgi:hypothetical protein